MGVHHIAYHGTMPAIQQYLVYVTHDHGISSMSRVAMKPVGNNTSHVV